jgi:lipopolysaccharide export system permease protein
MTLALYIARIFTRSLMIVLLLAIAIIFLFDLIELMRISSSFNLNFALILQMSVMKNYTQLVKALPFVMMISSMVTYIKLTKSYELIAARSLGFSLWYLLFPAIAVTFIFSVFFIGIINPIGTLGYSKYDSLKMRHIHQRESFFLPSVAGLWIKDKIGDEKYIINIKRIAEGAQALHGVKIFAFGQQNNDFLALYYADEALITKEGWLFNKVISINSSNKKDILETFLFPTNVSLAKIQEGLIPPEMLTVWKMPGFIQIIQSSGISANKYYLFLFKTLLLPFLNIAMVMLGAACTPRHPRFIKQNWLIIGGLIAGFIIYFLNDISAAFSLAGDMPVWLGASMPTILCLLLAIGMLMHFEEG